MSCSSVLKYSIFIHHQPDHSDWERSPFHPSQRHLKSFTVWRWEDVFPPHCLIPGNGDCCRVLLCISFPGWKRCPLGLCCVIKLSWAGVLPACKFSNDGIPLYVRASALPGHFSRKETSTHVFFKS